MRRDEQFEHSGRRLFRTAPGGGPGGQGGGGFRQQSRAAGGTVPSFLIDGGIVTSTSTYSGFNTTGVKDTQSAFDAGADTPTEGSSAGVAANPPGSHSISFNGNNKTQIIFGI